MILGSADALGEAAALGLVAVEQAIEVFKSFRAEAEMAVLQPELVFAENAVDLRIGVGDDLWAGSAQEASIFA